ncbi:uncharacterized protein [Miscanthus floridulus]|uniref:uncharacterized protein n=1 Tax=Miscanthus floridulus TaxID=154761 RepID=UPI00345B3B19
MQQLLQTSLASCYKRTPPMELMVQPSMRQGFRVSCMPLPLLARIVNMAATLRVLIVVLAVVSVSLRRAAATTVTVDEACKQHTKYPELCVKSLSSAKPEAKAAAEQGGLAGLAELSLSQAAQVGAETVAFVKGLENTPGGMPPVCLNECVAKFQGALADLQRSKVAVEEAKDVGAVNTWLSAAKIDGDTCMNDCQKVEGGGEMQIVDKIGDLGKMCSIAMSLTDASRNRPAAA